MMSPDSDSSQQAFMLQHTGRNGGAGDRHSLNADTGDTDDPPKDFMTVKKKDRRRKKSNRCVVVTVSAILFLIFCGAVVILVLLFLMVGERPPRIQLECGTIQGDFDSTTKTFIFKGIPFAQPPVGKLRWQPPAKLSNQSCSMTGDEVFHAVEEPNECVQKDPFTGDVHGSEDCLYLNIFTPSVDPLELPPVMVYIHGGYLQFGNATTPGYCPDQHNAAQMGMVFVNIQYRLSAFGFLVTHQHSGSGNYGLLDQIAALTWVKKNIRKFGGDPNKVTVFGQSSGGTSVFALMATNRTEGLFQRAWALSPSPILNKTLTQARDQNKFFLHNTNCSEEACLLNLSAASVIEGLSNQWDVLQDSLDLPSKGKFEPALLIVDGDLIREAPFDLWERKQGGYLDVPFIIGSTAQEIDMDPAPGSRIKSWEKDDLFRYVAQHLEPFESGLSNASLKLYESSRDAEYIFTTMTSDLRVNCGVNKMAEKAAAALTSPVYRYVVTAFPSYGAHPLNFPFKAKYAFHGFDIYAFLDTYHMITSQVGDSDKAFTQTVGEYFTNFAHSEEFPDNLWKPYPSTVALIGSTVSVNASEYHSVQCKFWEDHNFFSYSWIN